MLTGLAYSEVEFRIRDLLARAMEAGGFDPARDISDCDQSLVTWLQLRIMRPWDTYWPGGDCPSRPRAADGGRIAIANSDSGAYAFAHSAVDQATRAVRELLGVPEAAPAYARFPGPPLEKIGME
jgi:spermidine dehydrogenase